MWFFRIQGVYLRRQPLATLGLIVAVLGERIFSLLAFFLPLKVLLLAGSDGVPKYFAFFMEVEDKPFWLGVLAGCAVLFYLLAVGLEKLSSVIAGRAGEGVLKGANEIYVTSLQRREATTYFLQFATVSASATLLVLSLLVMGLINTWLSLTLIVLFVLEFIFPAAVIQRTISRGRPVSESWITTSWQGYLSVCRSINFLSGFGVLLAGFLLGAQGSVIWAILAIIILRQSLSAALSAIGLLIGLYRKRPNIDPLTFRESRLVRQDMPESRDFRILFGHERRTKILRRLLDGLGYSEVEFISKYRDGASKGIYEFTVELGGGEDFLLLNVFSSQRVNLLEHEKLLFDYISRDELNAPSVLAEFSEGPFQCQLLGLRSGDFVTGKEWQSLSGEIFSSLMSIRLPKRLSDDYLVSHQALEDRITEKLASRIVVALDTPEQRSIFDSFCQRLPEFRDMIRKVPVRLQNRDLLPRNVISNDEHAPLLINWRRWSVDRIGSVTPPGIEEAELDALGNALARTDSEFGEVGERGGGELVLLVSQAVALENSISSESFNQALQQMSEILARLDSLQRLTGVSE